MTAGFSNIQIKSFGCGPLCAGFSQMEIIMPRVLKVLLLPIVLGFLFLLAKKALPKQYRLRGWYGWFVGIILAVTAVFGLYAGIVGL